MTRNHEMVSSAAPIPVRVLLRNDVNIVGDQAPQRAPVVGDVRPVHVSDDVDDTEGEEEGVRLFRSVSDEGVQPVLHLADEVPFDGVDVSAGPAVDDRRLAFLVCPDLEPLLHLYVAPELF